MRVVVLESSVGPLGRCAPRARPGRLDEQPVALAHEYRRLAADVDLARLQRLVFAVVIVVREVAVGLARLFDPGVLPQRTWTAAGARFLTLRAHE